MEGTTPFPRLLHFTLDPYFIMLSVKQGGIKYHFFSLECSPIDRETGTQKTGTRCSLALIPCGSLRIIRYRLRVKWNNPGNGVAPFPTPCCSSYWKGSLRVTLDFGHRISIIKNGENSFAYFFVTVLKMSIACWAAYLERERISLICISIPFYWTLHLQWHSFHFKYGGILVDKTKLTRPSNWVSYVYI